MCWTFLGLSPVMVNAAKADDHFFSDPDVMSFLLPVLSKVDQAIGARMGGVPGAANECGYCRVKRQSFGGR
jgi:hypothetical protein